MKIYQNKKTRTFCFDIDNTICKTKNGDYKNSKPIKYVISFINNLYDKGHYIFFYTSRFNRIYKFNKKKINSKGYKLTVNQLKKWKVKYHELIMCKPDYDYIIDDKYPEYNSKKWIEYFNKKYLKN
tara:strand:+ start:2027 stop:2404 length:378 start_codon:yes stop_codon:yes gene_type:complete